MTELYGVFAVTVYGDKIRVDHYTDDWHAAIEAWDSLDAKLRRGDFPMLKWVCVRTYDDPEWNKARYVTIDSIREAQLAA